MKAARLPSPTVTRLALIAVALLIWQLAAPYGNPLFICPPSSAIVAIGHILRNPAVRHALFMLGWELGVAFGLSIVLGLAVGLLLGLSKIARGALMPIVLLLYATPQITILPVLILVIGIGPSSKVLFGVTHGFFPVVVTAAASVQNLRPLLMTTARSMGANPWQRFRYVLLPHMLPSFFTGMRLCLTAVLLGVLLAELYSSTNGIGEFTATFTQTFDAPDLFALLALIACGAVVLNELLRVVERRASRWKSTS